MKRAESRSACPSAVSDLSSGVLSTPDSVALADALTHFVTGPVLGVAPLGEGHLHETYLVQTSREPLVLQRVNTDVFRDVTAVMENIGRVTAHARARLSQDGAADPARQVLSLRLTRAGATHVTSEDGQVFRAFEYIADSLALQQAQTPQDAYEAGKALGEFVLRMADLPAPPLHVTLPSFHAPEQRFLQLKAALASDPVGRAQAVSAEWRAIAAREPLAYECADFVRDPELRVRVTHNDAKLNNILFDRNTRRSLCVVDLDTVMPGYLAFDFGDLVRTCVCAAAEDSSELSSIDVRLDYFEAVASGYLGPLARTLTAREHASLARGPSWIVLELAMRFLADYVSGDRYFKVHSPHHNLVRARAQLRLLERLEAHAPDMTRLLAAMA